MVLRGAESAPVNRLQVVTVEKAPGMGAHAVEMPARRDDTFKRAPVEANKGASSALDL